MTAYQLRTFRRAARVNARLLAGTSVRLSPFWAAVDAALDAFNIGSVTSPDYVRLIAAIERSADCILENQ
jgi:hypothetical protein